MDTYSPAIYRGDVPQPRYARAQEMKSWQDLNQVPVVHGFNQQSHHGRGGNARPSSRRDSGHIQQIDSSRENSTVFGSGWKRVESTRRFREHALFIFASRWHSFRLGKTVEPE